jgi:hypothetical protein
MSLPPFLAPPLVLATSSSCLLAALGMSPFLLRLNRLRLIRSPLESAPVLSIFEALNEFAPL